MIKVGIVGTGYTIGISKAHVRSYKLMDDVEIAGVYDVVEGRAEKWLADNNWVGIPVYDSYEELLSNVDAVSICTPNDTHTLLTEQAFAAGKHVLCEKPLGTDRKSTLKTVELADSLPLVDMIGLCYRGIPAVKYIRDLIDNDELGKIYMMRQSLGGGRISNPNVKLEWRMQETKSGPGAIADFGSHMLDLADYLVSHKEGKIKEVSCMTSTVIDERNHVDGDGRGVVTNDDCGVFTGKTESGTLLQFTASRVGGHQSLDIYCEKGYVSFRGNPLEVHIQKKESNEGYSPNIKKVDVPASYYSFNGVTVKNPKDIMYYDQGRTFIDAIKAKKKVDRNLGRGAYIQKLIDAVDTSAKEKRIVIL